MFDVFIWIGTNATNFISSIFNWKLTQSLTFGAVFLLPITAMLIFKIMTILFGGATISRIPSSRK